MAEEKRSREAHDRLTRVCDAMLEGAKAHPDYLTGMHCIAFVTYEERGGVGIDGYDDEGDDSDVVAIAELFMHLRAIMQANGKDMQIVTLPGPIGHG